MIDDSWLFEGLSREKKSSCVVLYQFKSAFIFCVFGQNCVKLFGHEKLSCLASRFHQRGKRVHLFVDFCCVLYMPRTLARHEAILLSVTS